MTIYFYEQLLKTIDKNLNFHSTIAEDLNARVGNQPIDKIIGMHGEIYLNENGRELRDFAAFSSLKVTNIFFRKKDKNKYTWNARGSRSLIEYIIINEKSSSQILDTHVFRGYDIYTDHYSVIAKIEILARWRKHQTQRIKNRNK